MDHPKFPNLFRPVQIGSAIVKNRIAISAHHAGWWVDQGLPSEQMVAYLEERAKGDVGLFVIGSTVPEAGFDWLENTSDAIIPRYKALADAGHRHGMAVFAQLVHPGYGPFYKLVVSNPPSAPPTQPQTSGPRWRVPSIEDLHRIARSFANAARRAVQGGIDGIELHAHEHFLHAQLLHPLWNTRKDEYGGSLENRMRYIVETLQLLRDAVGPRFPLGVRLKVDDRVEGGMKTADYIQMISAVEARGLIDYLSLTGGDGRFHHGPMPRPAGEWLPFVREVRAKTKLPVMHAGRITTPEMAEMALAEGWLDVVCLTKSHICDPHFARKARENRLHEIRYCTRCLQSCLGNIAHLTCVYNPVTSRETEWAHLTPSPQRRRVVVVGGGPAGMETALTAARRGHDVIVLEKESRVGGQIWPGSASPLRKDWARIAEFYQRISEMNLFQVRLNTNATPEAVLELKPDAVIVATGSRPVRLEILNGMAASTVHEALGGAVETARRVVIFDREGFNRALVVADFLSSKGIAVNFITPMLEVCPLVELMMREEMIDHLTRRGALFSCAENIVGWEDRDALRCRSTLTGEERILPGIDAVVAAIGSTSVTELATALRGRVEELHVIGDANLPQTVEHATYQGGRIGRLL